LEPFEHEPHLTRARLDSRPHALAPVPASASDSPIVAPDDFTSGDDLHLRNAVLDRVEGLVARSPNETGVSDVGGDVLSSDRSSIANADGVVEVDSGVDGRQVSISSEAF